MKVRLSPKRDNLEELGRLRERLAAAKLADISQGESLSSETPELERQVKTAEATASASGPTYNFRQLTRREKAEIVRKYPPTAEQWERYREKAKAYPGYILDAPEFDMVAAAPEVLALGATDPPLTLEQATQLWDDCSDNDAASLWQAAWVDDVGPPIFGTGTDMTPRSGPESTTAQNGESP
jgi:hypothetical protein